MKSLSTKTLINFLPFKSDVKLDLLEKFDSLSREQQLNISDIAWDAYSEIYNLKIKKNFDKGINEAEKNGEKIDNSFYGKVLEATQKEVEEELSTAEDSTDLSAARKSMEMILREMKSAKK